MMASRFRGVLRPFHSGSNSSSSSAYSMSSAGWYRSGATGVAAMDMTHAPGYRIAADTAPTPSVNARMAAFAIRHGGVPADSVATAPGYLWVGSVIYPSNMSPAISDAWIETHEASDADTVVVAPKRPPSRRPAASYTKRRFTGLQARRIRQQRQDSTKQTSRTSAIPKVVSEVVPKGDAPTSGEDA